MTAIRIPLIVDPQDPAVRQIWLDVLVGHGDQRLLLDTGAQRSTVRATSGVASLPRRSSPAGRGVAGGAVGEGTTIVVDEIRLAGRLLATGLEADLIPADSPWPGLLGADALQGHTCHFRFADGIWELDGDRPDTPFLLELERPGNAPFVEVRAGDLRTRACVDTGAGVTVVDAAFARSHPDVFCLTEAPWPGADAAGAAVPGVAGTMAPVRIAGALFPQTPCVAVDLAPVNAGLAWPLTIILGMPLLAQADWWFDFPANAWTITQGPA